MPESIFDVFADIHANLEALQAALADMDALSTRRRGDRDRGGEFGIRVLVRRAQGSPFFRNQSRRAIRDGRPFPIHRLRHPCCKILRLHRNREQRARDRGDE